MSKLIIFGTNDVSQLAEFYFRKDSPYTPVAFCVDGEYVAEDDVNGLPVVPFEEVAQKFPRGEHDFFVPLYDNKLRERKAAEVAAKGYHLPSYVSSKATVWSHVGHNCFIMENNVVQPFVKFGNNIILWSGNHIGHHSTIEDNVFFSSHVVLSGHCEVKKYSWFGVNATIRDHLKIAEGTFVCMGANLTHDTAPYKKYFGSPAKEIGRVD